MDNVVVYKYISIIGEQLEGFKQTGNNLWNFRCPLCGDSSKNKYKRRGYFYLKENTYRFHCHNCGADKKFTNFVYEFDPELYKELRKEGLIQQVKKSDFPVDSSTVTVPSISTDKYLVPISDLDTSHPAYQYLLNRGVPEKQYKNVFWTTEFDKLVDSTFGEKYESRQKLLSGIVFVLYSMVNSIPTKVGFQIRSIDTAVPKSKRFMICSTEGLSPSYGLERIDYTKPIYVTEGPIDSLFIPNCIAALSSTIWKLHIDNAIYINDCEPRNSEVCKQVKKCIDLGYKTVLLPDKYISLDINDIFVKFNLTEEQLINVINENTVSGLTATVKFSTWRK